MTNNEIKKVYIVYSKSGRLDCVYSTLSLAEQFIQSEIEYCENNDLDYTEVEYTIEEEEIDWRVENE